MVEPTMWNQFLVWPIINVLVLFYNAFTYLHIPGALGFAVIALTVTVRLLLYPLTLSQLMSAKKMQNLKPHLDALSKKHKEDKKALQQAQLDLYKEHGVNPAAGCVPMLLQFPILIALYNVFYQVLSNGNLTKLTSEVNAVLYSASMRISTLDFSFFGTDLGVKPSSWQTHGVWLLLVPLITAALQWYQSKLMTPPSPVAAPAKVEQKGKNEPPKQEDTAAEMQRQMMMITPIMFGMFAYQFPLGLALYWNVFALFGIMQQLQVNRRSA